MVRERTLLRVYLAWALFVIGDDAAGLVPLEAAERELRDDLPADERAALRGAMLALRGFLARLESDDLRSVALAREALTLLPAGELSWRSLAAMCLGNAAQARGDLDAAYQAFAEAEELGERAGDAFVMLGGEVGMVSIEAQRGNLRMAHRRCLSAYQRFTAPGWPSVAAVGYLELGLCSLAYEWNQLDEAERLARLVVERGEREQILDLRFQGPEFLALIARARGDDAAAVRELAAAIEEGAAVRVTRITLVLHAERAIFDLARGDLAAAEAWAASPAGHYPPEDAAGSSPLATRIVPETLARLRLAQGRPDDALALVLPLLAAAERAGHGLAVAETLGLLAMALHARGARDAALDAAERLVRWAQPEGILRMPLDEGPALRDVLAELAERRGETLETPVRAYLDELLAAFAAEPRRAHAMCPDESLAGQEVGTDGVRPERPGANLPLSPLAPQGERADVQHPLSPLAPQGERADVQHPLSPLAPQGEGPGVRTLSAREREVLALVAAGASNAAIADTLVVSVHTVKSHVKHIFEKLEVESRTQALARARELGLV